MAQTSFQTWREYRAAGNSITLHSMAYRPDENAIWVAHGPPSSAHLETYVRYDVPSLLRRD